MTKIDRRRVSQISGAGAVSAATGGLAGILASGRAPAFAQGTTLHWVRGSDYVPLSDQTVRTKINERLEKRGIRHESGNIPGPRSIFVGDARRNRHHPSYASDILVDDPFVSPSHTEPRL